MKVLITGGAGYIGSTVAIACQDAGIEVVVLDDLSTGRRDFVMDGAFYLGDFADTALLDRIVSDHPDITVVVHCAALIVVPDSVADPLAYYDNNVGRTITLMRFLQGRSISRVVFSSSASVYLADHGGGVDESSPLQPRSPYASTKAIVERVLADAAAAGQLRAVSLRYFNPIGADPAMRTGLQTPTPSHVLGKLIGAWQTGGTFTITGTDWPTRDGSGLRDFVHVWDLALAHVQAILRFDEVATAAEPFQSINLGAGSGTTVRELVSVFREVVGDTLDIRDGPRRAGDSAGAFAVPDKALRLLQWRAERSVEQGVRDSLEWLRRLQESAGA